MDDSSKVPAAELRLIFLLRRYATVLAVVAAWMALGWLLHLDTNQYLLLGVPTTVLFQLLIRRQPLRALWVREAPPFRLGWLGVLMAIVLALVPSLSLIGNLNSRDWTVFAYELCAIVGAAGAAYALRHLRRASLASLTLCLLTGLALDLTQWTIVLGGGFIEVGQVEGGTVARLLVGVASLLEYFAVLFVVEEVFFRMVDGYLHRADRGRGVFSALLISAMWGLWHLPMPLLGSVDWTTVGVLLLVHVPLGLSLSLFWRRSGNLTIPALSHALADAIRNAIIYSG